MRQYRNEINTAHFWNDNDTGPVQRKPLTALIYYPQIPNCTVLGLNTILRAKTPTKNLLRF